MVIDITSLKQGLEDTLYFDQDVNMDSTDESIKEIKDLHAKGSINLDIEGVKEVKLEADKVPQKLWKNLKKTMKI